MDASLLERLIAEDPSFHHAPDGATTNWAMTAAALRALSARLAKGMRTLETGAGQTTVVFLAAGCQHTCITPQPEHAERAVAYARQHDAPGDVRVHRGSSDVVLPRAVNLVGALDVVLIDGAHRFPFPCIDWHYTSPLLRIGGVLAVDDYLMPSVKVLHDFLVGEEEWKLLEIVDRTSFFEKLREPDVRFDCQGQKMNQTPYPYGGTENR